ncbi:relaxase domain-containing protein [Jatrophihabitans cynanchi]|uniref:Relaxase domain-containing protein n=1 Tax=Jatrophihabitans cynanchi TaxID=2944128 RepID=A0ABY7JUY5_9ACTN|nr:MobF family relaxase [Jatrophihabitans sp. SB3-54]WAX55112.1 relaxase domain-containing protein [Jatrophihabitans sp. SB3-54]
MTISIRPMKLGTGYAYLIESVARGDGAADRSSPLTRYYAETGTPPGRFLGAGLAGVNDGEGVAEGTVCSEEMLFNLLGLCADPVTGRPIGRRPGANTVAGFDLTFSVPKSISTAWALADAGTQSVIYRAHQEAIRVTIAYAEQHSFFSRSGRQGIVQEPIRGVVAAGFDHRDSRAGDPQLHTHVVIQNRAQSLDGRWRTLDSRALYRQVVTLSELHQGILHDLLSACLGWGWDARTRRHSPVPKWEVAGVAEELMREFSQRSAQIEMTKDSYIARFTAAYGRQPTAVEVLRMRQRATLATRPDKQHHSLAEQTETWRDRARPYVGNDTVAWLATLAGRNDLPALRADDLAEEILADLARSAVWTVADKRATFTRANILAEIHRQLHGARFADPADRIAVGEHTANLAVAEVLDLAPAERHHVPERFRRADGVSKLRGIGTAVYTTRALLDAEDRLLAAGRDIAGPRVDVGVVARVADAALPGRGYGLSTDQALAVEQVATSGRVLDVLVGPAGTGKSTCMAGLRAMWEAAHGPVTVVGLAPSAAAAEALGDQLGVEAENTAKWLTEARRTPDRLAEITRLEQRLARVQPQQGDVSGAHTQLLARLAALRAERGRWTLRAGQLVIIDEASLAGTFALDELVSHARAAGAKVLLVGDWAQLSAVEAGGAFAMLVHDRHRVPELTDVRRFHQPWEKAASTRLRVGDPSVIDTYTDHERIRSGNREDMLDALYTAWKTDTDGGQSSLMIAADAHTVAELNQRARTDRIATGHVQPAGLEVAAGGVAGVGDLVVTRENNRHLATGRRWVKNGDRWTVTATHPDGSMTVKRATGGGEVVLPAGYVREHVELAYATTAHRAQGATVDTAHALITVTTPREVLYVAATRGREMNRIYVDTFHDPDHDTSHGPVPETPVAHVLARVLANRGTDLAAHTTAEQAQREANSLVRLAQEYSTIAKTAEADHWQSLIEGCGVGNDQVVEVLASEAYGPLVAALRTAEARGLDIATALPMLVQARPLADAEDVAAVLHGRVDRWVSSARTGRARARDRSIVGLVPRAAHVGDPDMARALDERAAAMEHRAAQLVSRAIERREPWIAALGTPPTEPAPRAQWLREARTVAAFRELHATTAVSVENAHTATEAGDARAALAAIERARAITNRQTPGTASTVTEPVVEQIGVQR